MADKKLIDKDHVKQNNPNDDEEIIKNSSEPVIDDPGDATDESKDNEKAATGNDARDKSATNTSM